MGGINVSAMWTVLKTGLGCVRNRDPLLSFEWRSSLGWRGWGGGWVCKTIDNMIQSHLDLRTHWEEL